MTSPSPAVFQPSVEVKSLYEIAILSSSQIDLQDYFNRVITILSEHFPIGYSVLILQDIKKDSLHVEALYGMSRGNHPLVCGGRKGMIGKVLETRQPMTIMDLNQEPLYEEMETKTKGMEKIRCPLLCTPLIAEGEPIGVMNINSLYGQKDQFTKDFQFLSVLSAILSPVIKSLHRKGDEILAGPAKSKSKSSWLERVLEERLVEVLNKIDPYLETKARLGFLDDIIATVEKILIKSALEKVGHVQVAAAQLLGINRNTLRKKMKDLKIKV